MVAVRSFAPAAVLARRFERLRGSTPVAISRGRAEEEVLDGPF